VTNLHLVVNFVDNYVHHFCKKCDMINAVAQHSTDGFAL